MIEYRNGALYKYGHHESSHHCQTARAVFDERLHCKQLFSPPPRPLATARRNSPEARRPIIAHCHRKLHSGFVFPIDQHENDEQPQESNFNFWQSGRPYKIAVDLSVNLFDDSRSQSWYIAFCCRV